VTWILPPKAVKDRGASHPVWKNQEPELMPHTPAIVSAAGLQRPHFLDQDLRYLFAREGNRAILFTLVSRNARPRFKRDMERQVFWWQKKRFPEMADLSRLSELDGILLDVAAPDADAETWQDHYAPQPKICRLSVLRMYGCKNAGCF